MRIREALILFSAVALVAACKAKAGDKCTSAGECAGSDKALICAASSYVSATCKGPDGCMSSPFRCDFLGNAAGDPCADREDVHAMHCTPDKKARVRCVDGKVDRDECDGPSGCFQRSETSTPSCDHALKVGGQCALDGDWCSTDGKDWLTCKDKKLVVASRCRGPAACKAFGEAVACDVSIAQVADECVGSPHACSVDGARTLSCASGKFQVESTCPAGKACRASSDGASCVAK